MKEMQLMLGYSQISITMDTYGHKPEQLEHETAERMDAFIRSKWNKKTGSGRGWVYAIGQNAYYVNNGL